MAQILPSGEFGGLDLITDDVNASPVRARSALNVQKKRSSSLRRRQGYKANSLNSGNVGGFGTCLYKKRDRVSTGAVTKERLVIGARLYKQTKYTLTVTYSGSGIPVMECLINPTTLVWEFHLFVDGVSVLDEDLGIGFDEASPVLISDLLVAINAVTDFSATTTGGNSAPAAFLPVVVPTQIDGSFDIDFYDASEVNHPTSAANPFAGAYTNRNSDEFENVSTIQMNDVIYFGSKWDERKKYDGVDCYRAGMPQGVLPTGVGAGSGTLLAGTYKYAIIYTQKDALGNIIEGIESTTATVTTGGVENINLTVTNILAATGFNTDCAIVAGAQVGVTTITVDDGSGGAHTMKVGQTAYFYDGASAAYVERLITAKNATTITIAGAVVNVSDNAVISNNLKIQILRSVASGTILKYHTAAIPNNSFTATQVYNDGLADGSLGDDFDSPSLDGLEHGLPPKGGYLAVFDKALVSAGEIALPDTFKWSINGNPEYYPSTYSDYVPGSTNSSITGLASGDRFFWLHKEDESFLITGNLFTAQYSVTQKGDKVGSVAHASIARSDRRNVWLSNGAVFESIDGSVPERISDDISPFFDNSGRSVDAALQFKRAVGVIDKKQEYYILFIPAESDNGGDVYANSNSKIMAFDLRRKEWWPWDNMNMAGGAFIDEEDFVWTERRLSTFTSDITYKVFQRISTNSIYDYVDHNAAIVWEYIPSGWYHEGQPDVNKKYNYVSFQTADPDKKPTYTLNFKTERDLIPFAYRTELTHVFGAVSAQGWGYQAWGLFAWGNPVSSVLTPRRLKAEDSKSIRFSLFASGIYEEVLISGISRHIEAPFAIDINEARASG